MKRPKVHFIGIGAQKAGTTWLWRMLKQHPDISMGTWKEANYFNTRTPFHERSTTDNYSKGLAWYLKMMDAKPDTVNGEISTNYMWDPKVAKRIHKDFPDVKILAVLRDPVQRAYSQFRFANSFIHLTDDVRLGMKKYPEFKQRGLYYKQLKPYFDLFPRKNIKVIFLEDIEKDGKGVLKDVHRFLGVKHICPPHADKKQSPTKVPRFVWITKLLAHVHKIKSTRLGGALWNSRPGKRFVKFCNNIIYRINLVDKKPKPLPKDVEKELRAFFRKDIEQLEKLLRKDLSMWK